MNCKKIAQWLRTDYLDGELSQEEGLLVKEHLLGCLQCRQLEEELRHQRIFFQETKQKEVPAHLWRNVQNAILRERLNEGKATPHGLAERIKDLFVARRPLLVLGNAVAMIAFVVLFTGTVIYHRQVVSKGSVAEVLVEYSLSSNDSFVDDLGTNVEEYFL